MGLSVQEFFRLVLPPAGWFYVVALGGAVRKGKHKGYKTLDSNEAVGWAMGEWQRSQLSVYFTPCTWTQQYVQNEDGKNKNCRKHPELVHRLRCLWLDIDSLKLNQTVKESSADLVRFTKQVGLPLPNAVVRTGGGIHVYWAFDEDLTLAQWQPMADALKNACQMHGFKADPVCTADSARVLRLPGSRNFKYPDGPVATVSYLSEPLPLDPVQKALAKYQVDPLPSARTADPGINEEFSAGGIQYEPGRVEIMAQNCPLIAAVAADGGATCAEPLWKGLLHICAHAADGPEWAHKLSSGHPAYDPTETDRKLSLCDLTIPPTRCKTLEEHYGAPSPCDTCPHKGKVKGPSVLGREQGKSTIKPPEGLPDGYFVTAGGVFHTRAGKDGESDSVVRVCQVPILQVQVHDIFEHSANDAKITPHIYLTFADRRGRTHTGMFPMSILPDYRALYAAMSSIKFPFTRHDHKNGFDTLMTNWVQKLRETGEVTTGKPQFGWHMKSHDEAEGFAIGRTMYLPDGTSKTMMWPDTQLNHVYSPEGNIAEWRKAVDLLLRRNRPELMTLVAGAFAAPLFTFLGESSAVVSAVSSQSGVGKSSAMKVAQAVWGNPKTGLTSLDDTAKSVARKMGIIKNLPVFWDELRLTDDTAQEFLQMMFQLSQGREKTRLTSGVEFREAGTWETILVCASNNHLSEFAYGSGQRTNANLKRLFEYEIAYDGETPQAVDGTEVFNNLRHNYGHAGIEYAKFLIQNVKRVRTDVLTMNRALYKATGARNEDRYWIGTMATLLMGAKYAKELGLVNFDTTALKNFLLQTYQGMQETEAEAAELSRVVYHLQEFLRENEGASIVFKSSRPRPGPGQKEEPLVARIPMDTRHGLLWEYFIPSGTARISRHALNDYLRKRSLRRKEFIKELEALGYICAEVRCSMGAGTRFEGVTRAYCYEIDIPAADRSILSASTSDEDIAGGI